MAVHSAKRPGPKQWHDDWAYKAHFARRDALKYTKTGPDTLFFSNQEITAWAPWVLLAASYFESIEDYLEYEEVFEEIVRNNQETDRILEELAEDQKWGNEFTGEELAERLRKLAKEHRWLEERERNLLERMFPAPKQN